MLSDKRIKRYLSMAKSASELSDYIHNKVGCIFVYKKDIVAVGYNHKVTSPLQKKYNKYRVSKNGRMYDVNKQKNYIHAEADALIRASKKLTDDELKECKVFIYRQTKSGIMGLSRCCNACYKMLEDVGIKEIYYSKDIKGYGHEVITDETF